MISDIADRIDHQADCLDAYAEAHGFEAKPVPSVFHLQAVHFRDLAKELRGEQTILDFAEIERRAWVLYRQDMVSGPKRAGRIMGRVKCWNDLRPEVQIVYTTRVVEDHIKRTTEKPTLIRWAEENEQQAANLRAAAASDPSRRHAIKTAEHLEQRAAEYRNTVAVRGDR